MSNFLVRLWDAIFLPGTNRELEQATHASFVLLTLSLVWMLYTSRSIHFFNLLVISLCLWAAVAWFLTELKKEKAKLKSNGELLAEQEETSLSSSSPSSPSSQTPADSAESAAIPPSKGKTTGASPNFKD